VPDDLVRDGEQPAIAHRIKRRVAIGRCVMPVTHCFVSKRPVQSTVRLAPASLIGWADLGERELVAGCIRGDAAAWGELDARYRPVVYAGVARALRHGSGVQFSCTAEDLVDEFFADVFARPSAMLGRFDPTRPLAGYLKTAAYHNALKRLRSSRFRWLGRMRTLTPRDHDYVPDHRDRDRPDLADQLDGWLRDLDEQSRWIIHAYFGLDSFQGHPLTAKQLGDQLHCSKRSVYYRIEQILSRLASVATGPGKVDHP
jgi:RNA polymerase sigma factor (sigma-70 family)